MNPALSLITTFFDQYHQIHNDWLDDEPMSDEMKEELKETANCYGKEEAYHSMVIPFDGQNPLTPELMKEFCERNRPYPVMFFPEEHYNHIHTAQKLSAVKFLIGEGLDLLYVTNHLRKPESLERIDKDYKKNLKILNGSLKIPVEDLDLLEEEARLYSWLKVNHIPLALPLDPGFGIQVTNENYIWQILNLKGKRSKIFFPVGFIHLISNQFGDPLQHRCERIFV